MKIVTVLAVIAIVAVSAMPLAFAEGGSSKDKPDTIFQRLGDKISEPLSVEVKPLKKVEDFQKMSDGIDQGSKEAKPQSLRANPRKLADTSWL
ncbi:MAG: hypothetical protein NTW09_05290 [Candidatus Omnitrophica bacterium]|nr:hypothetical protein [Candidatus Omnitrophota bacterium]